MKIRVTSVAIAALLSGCAIPNPTAMEHLDDIPFAKFSEIDAIPEIPTNTLSTTPHATLADVVGVSCRRSFGGQAASWEDAVRRTKYRAMQKGANAIANLSCGPPEGRSLTTLCFESIRCTASAIQIQK